MEKNLTAQEAAESHRQALREENRRLRYLRFLVDLALMEIRAGRYTRPEAERIVANVRSQALQLFPGKELAFELIYQPRFRRVIAETFQLH
jgi:hypothetical protein|uniref:Uncharacterized protein n=1 Tax=Desulfobacca acetoxidans TaxID=60893 RepID=A0A7C3V5W7_9BACT